ncbi:MAG TPA: DUF559 domain-containing protein [Sulfurimonas sp.]|nr:DUF559 domain-containing protein [Sulfurimonas sp.]
MDPYKLSQGTPLPLLKQQGIYNRAILIAAERSPYTKGLESELKLLQTVEENKYQSTSLGVWLSKEDIESPTANQQPLLEVLPLNSEQRQAVRQSLSNPLTVITGPPGTGKSQVVSSILVNTAWQNKTVLFASKNNKAVDVVEARVNSFGPRPILLRVGPGQYQSRLAEYIVSLLALRATEDDQARYFEFAASHKKLEEKSEMLVEEMDKLISLRNDVDLLEQQVQSAREDVGDDVFQNVKNINFEELEQDAIDEADKSKQSFLILLIWSLIRNIFFEQINEKREVFLKHSIQIGLPMPQEEADVNSIEKWINYRNQLSTRLEQLKEVSEYFGELKALSNSRPLEELSRQWKLLTDDLSKNSELLWEAWLRLQPTRLNKEQRKLLGDYSSLLQIIVSANEESKKLGKDFFNRYYKLSSQISSILSCWAVTSLSARGRIPFDPNFFDLLVIDEASQCDISSVLPLLYRASRVVIIGDPKQLRHISTLSKQQDQQLLSKHDLVNDFPGWAYSTRSVFDLASSLCRSEDIVELRDHHRSHADIIEFSNEYFYEGRLRMATSYDKLQSPNIKEAAVRWIDVKGKTFRPGTGGALNEKEAHAVVDEIARLVNQGYRGSIGVVSPFRAQANRIRDLVHSSDGLIGRLGAGNFLADTVHRFQGDERDVMFFSPVVSSNVTPGALGFLRNNPNLFNVAITRARAALIVVGDRTTALNSNVEYLSKFVNYIDNIGDISQTSQNTKITDFGPEYPDVSRPESVSDWERKFYKDLYNVGVSSIPQYNVEKYVLDFAIIKDDRRLNIEIDGEKYHRNWDGELCRRDQIRNQRMMELGWDVMRFWVYQVRDELDQCLARVQNWIAN